MRRGRPVRVENEPKAPKPSPSPLRSHNITSDPFSALDSSASSSFISKELTDDISSRFPPIDQFSLLHDSSGDFIFEAGPDSGTKVSKDIKQRVTDALADDAFAKPSGPINENPGQPQTANPPILVKEKVDDAELSRREATRRSSSPNNPTSRPMMVSTGTMTSPPPSSLTDQRTEDSSPSAFHVPLPRRRSPNRSGQHGEFLTGSPSLDADAAVVLRPGPPGQRSKSHISSGHISQTPLSSRPSLESQRPSMADVNVTINRSKSASSRLRPASVQIGSKRSFLRSREQSRSRTSETQPLTDSPVPEHHLSTLTDKSNHFHEITQFDSSVDFLRAMEEDDSLQKKEKRLNGGSRHAKRASMPSLSLANTKSLLAGKFGDAFRRFETNGAGHGLRATSPSPEQNTKNLTPIAGSEATDGRSDDENELEEAELIPQEVRRELERRRLSQEERRVAEAAAAYRQRFSKKADASQPFSAEPQVNSRAVSIQSKVMSLLDEANRKSPTKSAGDHSCLSAQSSGRTSSTEDEVPPRPAAQPISRIPPSDKSSSQPLLKSDVPSHLARNTRNIYPSPKPSVPSLQSTPPSASFLTDRTLSRPSAPPKPHALRATGTPIHNGYLPKQHDIYLSTVPSGKSPSLASPKGNTSKNDNTYLSASAAPAITAAGVAQNELSPDEDWATNFRRRFPTLAGLESEAGMSADG